MYTQLQKTEISATPFIQQLAVAKFSNTGPQKSSVLNLPSILSVYYGI